MILGVDGATGTRRSEYASQVPERAREEAPQKPGITLPPPPAWMKPAPAEKPAAAPQKPVPAQARPAWGEQQPASPKPTEAPFGSWLSRAPESVVDAARAKSKPVMLGTGKPVPEEPIGKGRGRDLTGFSYTVSGQELERLRRNDPNASAVVEDDKDRAIPLTWKEYDKLSFDQKAAVDFNTLLVDAREKDLLYNDPSQYTQSNIDAYNRDVESIFGEGGGSDKKAFNVVKLLKTINFKAIGQDLDEFLSLDRAINTDELRDFKFSREDIAALEEFDMREVEKAVRDTAPKYPGVPSAGRGSTGSIPQEYTPAPKPLAESSDEAVAYAGVRTPQNLAAIDTELIRNTMAAYKKRLETGGPNNWNIQTAFDGTDFTPANVIPVGYGRRGSTYDQQFDAEIEAAFGILAANPNKAGMQAVKERFKTYDYTPEDQKALWQYINSRSLRDLQYSGADYAGPLRQFLGWE